MEKLKMHSPDLVAGNIEKIAALFPNCITEAKDAAGKLTRAVDFDLLKQELSGSLVEGPQERYRLDWPGKREALLAANAPIAKTLRPCREESVDFDTTKNLFIEGDNLDALKLLQESYLNKIKFIFIDPPYNTGNDFIYSDDRIEGTQSYLVKSNQADATGVRLAANTESNGRFHSDWLTMINPRLRLAKNLLNQEGVIFVAIGEDEVSGLDILMGEIFGRDNRIGIISRMQKGGGNKGNFLNPVLDYILVYSKNKDTLPSFTETIDEDIYGKTEASGPRAGQKYAEVVIYMPNLDYRENQRFWVSTPDGGEIAPPEGKSFRWTEKRFNAERAAGNVVFKPSNKSKLINRDGSKANYILYQKRFLDSAIDNETARPNNFFPDFQNMQGSKELSALKIPFDYPKPVGLIKHLMFMSKCRSGDIALDFFSGSATTAHAVMQLNAEDGGSRRYIMVQLPEPCDVKSDAFQSGYKTISDIGKERIRRASKLISSELKNKRADANDQLELSEGDESASAARIIEPDAGFRALKIDSSNTREVYYRPDGTDQGDLLEQTDNIREDRTPEDLLFQVMLDWGVDLGLPISSEKIAGKTVYFVDGNALAACFDTDISEDLVTALAKRRLHDLPLLKVVFRDAGYASDSDKINVEQIFKLLSPTTELRTL
ncbi:MAG: site-specific DNA-methyltransferase [Opitutus sp.]|nr:site-specific DNA-methyltransferase [Opitutus sp.]MCS6247944.1 site-specific DNA-methyltransferase [Opitutus sp.]MCS6274436.1 site-specific DNA-methyltransferase [Opitutus sp.]MCS6277180.1 site-specific DNA-methyltransferase [Opitutus sp.]MCS6300302.1 site-specific DNA-methyltransferase [Opitutus sp.]